MDYRLNGLMGLQLRRVAEAREAGDERSEFSPAGPRIPQAPQEWLPEAGAPKEAEGVLKGRREAAMEGTT